MAMGLCIKHYSNKEITLGLIRWLDDNEFYDTRFTDHQIVGLRSIYMLYLEGESIQLSHIWIGYVDETPMSVALIDSTSRDTFQMLVKEGFRSRGYGRKMLEEAIRVHGKFGATYTGDSRALYQEYHIENLCEE